MTPGLPRWFRFIVVVTLLALCIVTATQIVYQNLARNKAAEHRSNISISQAQMPLQKRQYEDRSAKLAAIEAELAQIAPLAQAAEARFEQLKAERSLLRKEAKELAKQVDELKELYDAVCGISPDDLLKQIEEALALTDELRTLLGN